jgi:hypothetical protein
MLQEWQLLPRLPISLIRDMMTLCQLTRRIPMTLEERTFADLIALYNSLSDKKAGPKTFSSRAKIIERIRKIADDQGVALQGPHEPSVTKKRGSGVGELACRLLLSSEGYPYKTIAEMVNAEIPGSSTTTKAIRWYASKMRKDGIDVPARLRLRNDHIWITDPKESAEQFRGVCVVTPDTAE